MKPISEAAKRKAADMFNAERGGGSVWKPDDVGVHASITALARHLDEVSEVAGAVATKLCSLGNDYRAVAAVNILQPLILPDEPDPLEEIFVFSSTYCLDPDGTRLRTHAKKFREELTKRGFKIVKADQ